MTALMGMMRSKDSAVVGRFNKYFKSLNKCLVKRGKVVEQLRYAIACREHLLIEGKPGIAKSYMANLFLDNLKEAYTFKLTCTKKMSEDYLVGPLDMKKFKEEGIMHHITDKSLVDCDFAFVDEIFDLSSGALRGLLEILNERTFTRGTQYVESSLSTCIAATNFNKDDEDELEAVLDRFMFRSEVHALTNDSDRLKMLKSTSEMPKLHYDDIEAVQSLVDRVEIPDPVMGHYIETIAQLPKVTDRKLRKGLHVLKASAALSGRVRCVTQDIMACENAFSVIGNKASETEFTVAMQTFARIKSVIDEDLQANVVYAEVTKLANKLEDLLESSKTRFADIEEDAHKIVTLRLIAQRNLGNCESKREGIITCCDRLLMQVDNIREHELQ